MNNCNSLFAWERIVRSQKRGAISARAAPPFADLIAACDPPGGKRDGESVRYLPAVGRFLSRIYATAAANKPPCFLFFSRFGTRDVNDRERVGLRSKGFRRN